MYILHIETSTTICSSAISLNGEVIGSRSLNDGYKHAEMLAVQVQELLNYLPEKAKTLNAVSVSIGPGSYTGLRIGLSLAKGICFAANIPLITLNTLFIIANAAIDEIKETVNDFVVSSMLDAGRMEVYCMMIDQSKNIIQEPHSLIVNEETYHNSINSKIFLTGNANEKLKPVLSGNHKITFIDQNYIDAVFQAKPAFEKFIKNDFADLAYTEPEYLKEYNPARK